MGIRVQKIEVIHLLSYSKLKNNRYRQMGDDGVAALKGDQYHT